MRRRVVFVLKLSTAIAGVVALALPIVIVAGQPPGYHGAAAQFVAAGVLLVVTAVLLLPMRTLVVATRQITWRDVGGVDHTVQTGWIMPQAALGAHDDANDRKNVNVSLMHALYVGKDNRVSTSKSVALAWTYAIVFGLLSLLALKLMGDSSAWNTLNNNGLQEEYLLLLGGPYAAAVIAKYNVSASGADAKTSDPRLERSADDAAKSLIADDEGSTDIGDFQYVLFNLVALAFFLGSFVPHPAQSFPHISSLLVGLALTSAATYTAKKAATSAAGPQLASIFPKSADRGAPVELFGRNLVYEGRPPMISVSGDRVIRSSAIKTGAASDRLKFVVPDTVNPAPDCQVRVTTDNGAEAVTVDGTADFLTLTVT